MRLILTLEEIVIKTSVADILEQQEEIFPEEEEEFDDEYLRLEREHENRLALEVDEYMERVFS